MMDFSAKEQQFSEQLERSMTCIGNLSEDIAMLIRNGIYDIDRIGQLVDELTAHYATCSFEDYLYNRAILAQFMNEDSE